MYGADGGGVGLQAFVLRGGVAAGSGADVAAFAITHEQPAGLADMLADPVQRVPAVGAERLKKGEVRFEGARRTGGRIHDGAAERLGGGGGREAGEGGGQAVGVRVEADAERGAGGGLSIGEAAGEGEHRRQAGRGQSGKIRRSEPDP